ncbi:putative phosphoglycerate mutase [Pullulanibacillus pueri]|uniref:Histidine phosphatase family protein n=1 Tax=Pullulanibacillus pueri TaxID=1437324 RepID=A0A8J2ZUE7_9BACL|nr:histidine phosphatase family protein [Pullulanibacillus pueri]MBM7681631.1 putative phosphoglycerate mutase [Pullulanibacillus pueri]GGH79382.1 hypothetical protein GCM10007096_14220 [Pullulanibacillus pueri]
MIYVIRHGQTDLNKERRWQGRIGLPLNETGIKQAKVLKDKLKGITFEFVFSSPQERAVQTAEIVTGAQVITDTRLDVFDLGEADGLKVEEVKRMGILPDPNVYKGIEDMYSYIHRIFNFMRELENRYAHREINILLAGHRDTTGCIGAYFKGIPEDGNILSYSSNNGEYKVYDFK